MGPWVRHGAAWSRIRVASNPTSALTAPLHRVALTTHPTLPPVPLAWLQVDVEGAEAEVLAGMGWALWQRVDRVVAEVHDQPDDTDDTEEDDDDDDAAAAVAATADDGSGSGGVVDSASNSAAGLQLPPPLRGRRGRVDRLLRRRGGFEHVVWARAGLAASGAGAGVGLEGDELDNWVVYASRLPFG